MWHFKNTIISISFITIAVVLIMLILYRDTLNPYFIYISTIANVVVILMLVTIISTDDATNKQIKSLDESTRILQVQERTSKIITQKITPQSTEITDANASPVPTTPMDGRKALLVYNGGEETIYETDENGTVLGIDIEEGENMLYEFDPKKPVVPVYFICYRKYSDGKAIVKSREW